MASFDPQVPAEKPESYLNYSKVGSQPMANVSGATRGKAIAEGLSGIGTAIAESAHLGVEVAKQDIAETIHRQMDPVVNEWIRRYESVDNVLHRGNPESISQMNPASLPEEVRRLPGMVDSFIAMRDNGHISPIYVDMAAGQTVTDLRGKYPGLRKEIDEEMTRFTHMDPANKRMHDLIADINAQAGAARETKNKIGNMLLNGIKEFGLDPVYYDNWTNGKMNYDQVMSAYYEKAQTYAKNKAEELDINTKLKRDQLSKVEGNQNNTSFLFRQYAQDLAAFSVSVPGFADHEKITKLMQRLSTGEEPNEVESQQLARLLVARKAAYINRMILEGQKPLNPNDPQSRTRADAVGSEEYLKQVKASAEGYDEMIRQFTDKEKFALGVASMERGKAKLDMKAEKLLEDHPEIGYIAAIEKMAPGSQYAKQFFETMMSDDRLSNSYKQYAIDLVGKIATQSKDGKTPNSVATSGGASYTLDDAIQENIDKGVKDANVNQAVIDRAAAILVDHKAPLEMRKNVGEALSNPKNVNLPMKVDPSPVDRYGNVGGGRTTMIADLINDRTAKSIFQLGDPKMIQNWINTSRKMIGNAMWPEISTLNKQADNPNIKIVFHPEDYKFEAIPNQEAKNEPAVSQPTYLVVQDAIANLNIYLQSLKSVNKLSKDDPSAFLVSMFLENGMDPKLAEGTLGGRFLKAVIQANQTLEKPNANRNE